jgi:uncharacterized membrane protein YdjX (TVP38/TMEM64 family)
MEGFIMGFIIGFIIAVVGGTIHYSVVTHLTKVKLRKEYEWFFKGHEAVMPAQYNHIIYGD